MPNNLRLTPEIRPTGVGVVEGRLVIRRYDGRTIDGGPAENVEETERVSGVDQTEGDKITGYCISEGRLIFRRFDGSTLSLDTTAEDFGDPDQLDTYDSRPFGVVVIDGSVLLVGATGNSNAITGEAELSVNHMWLQITTSSLSISHGGDGAMTGDYAFDGSFNLVQAVVDHPDLYAPDAYDPELYDVNPEDWNLLGSIKAPYIWSGETEYVEDDYTLVPNDDFSGMYLYVATIDAPGTPGEEGSGWTLLGTPPPLSMFTVDGTADLNQGVPGTCNVVMHIGTPEAEAMGPATISATGLPTGISLVDNGDNTATISGTTSDDVGDYPVILTMTLDNFTLKLQYVSETTPVHVYA